MWIDGYVKRTHVLEEVIDGAEQFAGGVVLFDEYLLDALEALEHDVPRLRHEELLEPPYGSYKLDEGGHPPRDIGCA
jgi:hypothetical protein